MEMHQVRYFLAVADELNFSRAAEKCNVSQPSLSRAIQLLEGEFGGQLFRREYSRTHLSELGKMVRPYLETVYDAAVKAKQLSRDVSKAGTLNGWASPDILDAYDAERQPITDQVSRIIADIAYRVIKQRSDVTADIERQDFSR